MYNFYIITLIILHRLIPANFESYGGVLIIPLPKIPGSLISEHVEASNRQHHDKWVIENDGRNIESYEELNERTDLANYDDYDRNQNDGGRLGQNRGVYSHYGYDKIVGGVEVDINLYPYHVAYGLNCAGSIIHERWAITAGHCGKKKFIRVGSKNLHAGQKIPVKAGYIHPLWGAKRKEHPFDYDFQLLELAIPLKFSYNVQPIKIARVEDMIVGKVITVTGWGYTFEGGPYSNMLRAIRIPIISKGLCQNVPFPYYRGRLTSRMFCAGYSEGKLDACQGDSGGPAVADDRLLGIVSFGYGCATPGSYGVYGKVAKVRTWIQETTNIEFDYIMGGYSIKITDAPYHLGYGNNCGAVLIDKRWALTAAHCGTRHTHVNIGSTKYLEGYPINIINHIIHPLYQKNHEFDYDVQLLKLFQNLRFNKKLKAIPISKKHADTLYISGWGYPQEKGEYQDNLHQAKIKLVPKKTCQKVKKPIFNQKLTQRMFCAGGWKQDACQGDSGGGAVSMDGELVGISSFGYGCGRGIPGVYINVTNINIRNWIREHTGV